VGLTLFTLADSQVQPNFNTKGITMISMALLCDAVIGNVQEKSMRTYGAPNAEVVLFSYSIGFFYLLIVMGITGDFTDGLQFFATVTSPTLPNQIHQNFCFHRTPKKCMATR
jgi:adenosine 3'-phospho 5'-phosphosulfate transporter B3